MNIIRFLLSGSRQQFFSEDVHGENFKDQADRFHIINERDIISRTNLTKNTMVLLSWSSQSCVISMEDGRTITIAEGVPVSISPAEIVPAAPEAPVEIPTETEEAAPEENVTEEAPVEPTEPAS